MKAERKLLRPEKSVLLARDRSERDPLKLVRSGLWIGNASTSAAPIVARGFVNGALDQPGVPTTVTTLDDSDR